MERNLQYNYSMTPLIHNYSNKSGKTYLWDTSDSEENYNNNIKDPVKKQKLKDLGFLDTKISYEFNNHGFRTVEFDNTVDIVCFGCSFTMGTGVPSTDTWPSQLQKLSGMTVANLGHAGSSNDTAFRFAHHYLEILKPKYAIWLQTDAHRIELLDDHVPISRNLLCNDTDSVLANDYFVKTWFSSESNQKFNLLKNTLAFEQLCRLLHIRSVVVPRHQISADGLARDLQHPGTKAYYNLAKQILLGL